MNETYILVGRHWKYLYRATGLPPVCVGFPIFASRIAGYDVRSKGTTGMTLFRFEQEIWTAQFGARLVETQPLSVAKEVAMNLWPHLGLISPAEAVNILLGWALQERSTDGGPPSASA